MYYILKSEFALRGWQKLPFALIGEDVPTQFLDRKTFEALSLCNGDFDSDDFPTELRELLPVLEKNGVIMPCEEGTQPTEWQKYRKHPSRYINTAHWSITGLCNYKCKHCYMSAPDAKYGQLSTEKCLDICDQLDECGVRNVSITGGEPLVRKDFWQIVDRLLEHRIRIPTVYSNGKLVTSELLDEFDKRNLKPEFNMSFDGVGWHDWLRGVDGAEEAANQAFRLCKDRGFPTGAELTLHRHNKHTLRESINHLAAMGCHSVKTNPAAKTGAWERNAGDSDLSMPETFDAYLDYIPHFFEDGGPMGVMLGGFFMAGAGEKKYTIPAQKLCGEEEKVKRTCICGHARLTMYIAADGKVLPCMSLSGMDIQREFPSLVDRTLAECLTESYYMRFIDTRLDEYLAKNKRCDACEYKYVCGGGCRASALSFHADDIMSADESFCLIHRGGYVPRIHEAAEKAGGVLV